MARESLHPADGAALLTNGEWYETRARYYRATSAARDDALLPLPRPLGYVPARRVTRISALTAGGITPRRLLYEFDVAADDVLVDLALYDTVRRPPGRVVLGPSVSVYDSVSRRIVTTPGPERFEPDPTMSIVILAKPALERGPQGAIVMKGHPEPPDILYYPEAPKYEHIGMLAVQKDTADGHGQYLVRKDGKPIDPRGDIAWTRTPWAYEVALVFVPPLTLNAYGAPVPATFESFGALVPVIVRYPHPWLPESVFERAGTEAVTLVLEEGGMALPRSYRRLMTTSIVFPVGERQGIREVDGSLVSAYVHRDPKDLIEKVLDELERIPGNVRDIASRIGSTIGAAAQAVARGDLTQLDNIAAATLATALTGPAGLALLGSEKPWRDAIRIGATSYALALSPLVAMGERAAMAGLAVDRAATGGVPRLEASTVRQGVTPITEPRIQLLGGGVATASDIEAAEVLARQLMALDPDGAQSLMVKIVREGGFIDLVLARLVIEAEKDEAKRDALLAEITQVQAEWWQRYGSRIAQALGVVLDLFAPGVGQLLFALVNLLYQAALTLQGLEVQLMLERQAERELRAQLGDPVPPEPAPAPPPPTPPAAAPAPAAARPTWWRPWADWAAREWF